MGAAKIMIVEDNTTVATDCQDCLISLGYNVTSIQASGEESILKAETEMPDAVLMDIHLRDKMDGIKAAEQIYSQFQIPVVFLSAYSDRELLQRAKQVGSFGYLIKPFEERELYATLEMALYKASAEKKHKQMENHIRLQQKMESIGTLAGGIAHDFNNLLYVIIGNINLAEENLQNDNLVSENLKEAGNACLRAKKLTKKLITFSKGGKPVKKGTSIDKLVRDVVVDAFKDIDIQPVFSISKDINPIKIDISQIKQVFNNIAINAKEAMNNKGMFKLSVENVDITKNDNHSLAPGKYIKTSFIDNGIGISKHNINKIFDPYFSTKDMGVQKAQGLGLAICHSIITRHHGFITVESEPEKGAVFCVYLPVLAFEETDLQELAKNNIEEVSAEQSVKNKGKILVMDDEEAIRTLMNHIINRLGHDVETSSDGKQAIEIYTKSMESEKPFDAVILDLTNQFGMGGQETMGKLLQIDPDVKGIIITGYCDDPVVKNYRAYGFSGVLTKPVIRDELSRVLNEVISKN